MCQYVQVAANDSDCVCDKHCIHQQAGAWHDACTNPSAHGPVQEKRKISGGCTPENGAMQIACECHGTGCIMCDGYGFLWES